MSVMLADMVAKEVEEIVSLNVAAWSLEHWNYGESNFSFLRFEKCIIPRMFSAQYELLKFGIVTQVRFFRMD